VGEVVGEIVGHPRDILPNALEDEVVVGMSD